MNLPLFAAGLVWLALARYTAAPVLRRAYLVAAVACLVLPLGRVLGALAGVE